MDSDEAFASTVTSHWKKFRSSKYQETELHRTHQIQNRRRHRHYFLEQDSKWWIQIQEEIHKAVYIVLLPENKYQRMCRMSFHKSVPEPHSNQFLHLKTISFDFLALEAKIHHHL